MSDDTVVEVQTKVFGVGGEVLTYVVTHNVEHSSVERYIGLFEPTQDFGVTEQI